MELGVHVINFNFPGHPASIAPSLKAVGEVVEALGITSLSVMDHYFQMDQMAPATDPMLEGYTTLGFLAAHTSTARLGLLVTGVTYRYPGLLAKIVATLDTLSGGRAQLGIGAAWYEREHLGLGVPYPPVAERFERLEETIQICLQMWNPDNNGAFKGRHYELAETLCSPLPISSPRPPIMIGGSGERKTLRLVAQYADACNIITASTADLAHKLDVLRRHCDAIGRDEATIRKTALYRGAALEKGDVDALMADMSEYARLGVHQVIVTPPGGAQPEVWIEEHCAPLSSRLTELA